MRNQLTDRRNQITYVCAELMTYTIIKLEDRSRWYNLIFFRFHQTQMSNCFAIIRYSIVDSDLLWLNPKCNEPDRLQPRTVKGMGNSRQTICFMEVAIDSRLFPAKFPWRHPTGFSKSSLERASYLFMYIIVFLSMHYIFIIMSITLSL